ncbi:hypothetical protein PGS1_07375 [Enterobacter cloacae subsp. cloacae GS1]|nr:hypothetical protein PGS1_07375 [Enterobacter cloacae subsp. cloacae GS1]
MPSITPSSRAHASTFARAFSLVFAFPASTRDTVLMESCVRAAISVIFSLFVHFVIWLHLRNEKNFHSVCVRQ